MGIHVDTCLALEIISDPGEWEVAPHAGYWMICKRYKDETYYLWHDGRIGTGLAKFAYHKHSDFSTTELEDHRRAQGLWRMKTEAQVFLYKWLKTTGV